MSLVLTRRLDEAIVIDTGDPLKAIRITVQRIDGLRVELAIDAPREYRILREELTRKEKPAVPAAGSR